jgi:hypothetical protein
LSEADQKLAGMSFDQLVEKVTRYARTWPDEYKKHFGVDCPLSFDFSRAFLDPPAEPRVDGGKSTIDAGPLVEYDVLVSLSSLPFPISYEVKVAVPEDELPPPSQDGASPPWPTRTIDRSSNGEPLKIIFPTSELGRYATRCDYGVPTIYLGRPDRSDEVRQSAQKEVNMLGPHVAKELNNSPTDSDVAGYFGPPDAVSASQEFEATIVHEFGHVLGLAHLHQSPLDRPRWRSIDQIRSIVAAEAGVEIDEDAVRSQVMLPFPSTQSIRGEVLYSDWAPLPRDENGDPQLLDAAMIHPLLQFMLVPAFDQPASPVPPIQRQLKPTPVDLKFLRGLYEPTS